MKNDGEKLYEIYKRRKNEILSIAQEQASIIKDLGLDEVQSKGTKKGEVIGTKKGEMINGLIDKLQSDKLKVLVLGRFSSGKSTFINALFGKIILPASPTPTTAVLCEVKHAEDTEKRAILFPKPGMGKNSDDSPFEVPISNIQEELKKYIIIDHFGTSEETSCYKKLELYYPLHLCEDGVEIIDTIGLDDPDAREKETLQYLPFVDVVIYCMKSLDTYSGVDKSVLNLLKSLKYDSIFFVITYYDAVKESVQLGEMISEDYFKSLQYKNLAPWTELGEQGIMFVDSRSAIKGKMNDDKELIESSGIIKVEKSLESFLVQEKGRAKLLNSLLTLKDANRAVRQLIPSRILMLQTDIEVLEERYEKAEEPLKILETKRQLMINKVDLKITDLSTTAHDMANVYLTELPTKINKWSSEYKIKSKIGIPPTKKKLEVVVSEVVNYIKEMIEEDIRKWNDSELSPKIELGVEELKNSLETQAHDFVKSVELLRVQISVGEHLNTTEIAKQKEVTTGERVLAVTYALLTHDYIGGGMGLFLGTKGMLNTVILEIIAAVLLVVLGIFNPVVIAAAVIAAAIGGGFMKLKSLDSEIKKTIAEKFIEEIGSHKKEICERVETGVKDSLGDIRDVLDAGLAGEINSIRGEVEKVLHEKTSGKLDIDKETKKLRDFEQKNIHIEEELDKLLSEAKITG